MTTIPEHGACARVWVICIYQFSKLLSLLPSPPPPLKLLSCFKNYFSQTYTQKNSSESIYFF